MTPVLTVFARSPDGGQGLARDMRVRWALEEAGIAYEVRGVTFEEMRQPPYRTLHPFGQIPVYQEGGLVLFESGAILLHIAQAHAELLPIQAEARARAITWLFAALNTVEPPIVEREQAHFSDRGMAWHDHHAGVLEERIRTRLGQLSAWLTGREWLEDRFSIADLMMIMVLRRAEGMAPLAGFPDLVAYMDRGKARPAYQRAYTAQRALYAPG